MRRHPLIYLSTAVFLLVLALACEVPLQARAAGTAPPPQAHTRQIDWLHPLPDQPHRAGMALVAALPGSQAARSVQPAANFPSGCYQGIAYNVIVQGHTSWTAQKGNQKAQVWYQWCPRWAGGQIGINWSYGKIFQLSGCADISVGGPLGNEVSGALLFEQKSHPNWVNDGEAITSYHTCAGGWVWDYSRTDRGDGLYKVGLFEATPELTVTSPCYC